MVVAAEDSYIRCAVHLRQKDDWQERNRCAARMYQHKKDEKPYPTMNTAFYSVTKWGLPKLECSQELWVQALKIQYGNGAAVVVRARENLVHGEGRQGITNSQKERCVRHHEKSPKCIGKS